MKVDPFSRSGAPADLARRAWQLLVEFTPTMRASWANAAAAFDLAPAQAFALRGLDPDRPIPMNTLAEAMICDASNITGLVDKLEARGLVVRQADPNDRRVKMLAVTERGAEVRRQLLERASRPPEALAALSPDEQRRLCDILEKMLGRATRDAE